MDPQRAGNPAVARLVGAAADVEHGERLPALEPGAKLVGCDSRNWLPFHKSSVPRGPFAENKTGNIMKNVGRAEQGRSGTL